MDGLSCERNDSDKCGLARLENDGQECHQMSTATLQN